MRLRSLHSLGFVHNDIKLANMVVGHQDSDCLYLIDFGMSSRYIDKNSGQHLPKKKIGYF